MAIIYSYPSVASLQTTDLFIISRVPTDPDEISNFSVSADALASFVTARVNLNFLGDTGTGIVNLDTQNLSVIGTTNEIETSASSQTLQIGLPDSVTITNNLTIGGDFTGVRGVFADDLSVGADLSVSGNGEFAGQVTIPLTPVANTDAASKGYVDAVAGVLVTLVNFNFADDTAAAAGGIPVGGLYHNAGVVRIRLT